MDTPDKKALLSVVIPAYNEENRIGATLADIERFFSHAGYRYEVIVVSDGSTDRTADIVRGFGGRLPSLRLIEYGDNRGKGYAVQTGMLAATGEYRLFMDADNSVRIDTVEPFIEEAYRSGSDVVIGSIAFSDSDAIEHAGWYRRAFGKASKLLIRAVATPGIYDTQRGFKLFTERAAEAIFPLQKIERFGFDIELLVIARLRGLAILELPVVWENPAGSKVSLRSYVDSFVELWKVYAYALRGAYDGNGAALGRAKAEDRFFGLILSELPIIAARIIRELATSDAHIRELKQKLRYRLVREPIAIERE